MKVLKLYLDGYRNVSEVEMELKKITAIVGLNNFGKTNFFAGLLFGQKFITSSPRRKIKMMHSSRSIPMNIETAEKNFKFGIEFVIFEGNQELKCQYNYEFEWPVNNKENVNEDLGAKIIHENLKIKDCESKKFTTVMRRKKGYFEYKTTETTRTNKKVEIEDSELAINKVKEYKDLYYIKCINEINNIKFSYNNFFNVEKSFNSVNITSESDSKLEINGSGNNICEVIYKLKDKYPEKYELLINAFKMLIPTIEFIEPYCMEFEGGQILKEMVSPNVKYKIPDKVYGIKVKEKMNNQITPIEFISSGSKRIFILITSLIISDINNIPLVMFEELENSIHPYLFQRLIIILDQLGSSCNILISSHSPYLIQYMDLKNIYLGIPSKNNVAMFKKIRPLIQKKIIKIAQEDDVSIGDYIFDLLVNSIDEPEEINTLIE